VNRAWLFVAVAAVYSANGHARPACTAYYKNPVPSHRHRVADAIDRAAVDLAARNFESGRRRLEKQLEKHHDSTAIQFWLLDAIGSSYLMEGRFADAAARFERAAALPELNVRGQYEALRKLAYAHMRAENAEAAIGALEHLQDTVCAPPLAHRPGYYLALSYFRTGQLKQAEETLAPLLRKRGEVALRDLTALDFRVQCAQGRARPCVQRFLQLKIQQALLPVDAEWFSRLLPAIAKSKHADDLLAEARPNGWIDTANRAVPDESPMPSKPGTDELVPIYRHMPQYPLSAARAGVQGSVLISVTVGPDGNALWVGVLESNPPGIFDEASLEAVSKWKFKPALADGVPVESTGEQRIEFLLERD
jgi:TonB family protein